MYLDGEYNSNQLKGLYINKCDIESFIQNKYTVAKPTSIDDRNRSLFTMCIEQDLASITNNINDEINIVIKAEYDNPMSDDDKIYKIKIGRAHV